MPTRDAAPRPIRKPNEKLNAPGREIEGAAGSKCSAPLTITASVVSSVPIQRLTVSVPIA